MRLPISKAPLVYDPALIDHLVAETGGKFFRLPLSVLPANDGGIPVPGPKGDKGDQGEKGDKGDPGAASTVPGPKGDTGDAGAASTVPGPKGDAGAAGASAVLGTFTWSQARAISPFPSAGTMVRVADIGLPGVGTIFVSDGASNYFPVAEAIIYNRVGSPTTPIATFGPSIALNTLHAMPGGPIVIPARLIVPGVSKLRVRAALIRKANNGALDFSIAVGTTGTVADQRIAGGRLGNNNNIQPIDVIVPFPETSRAMSNQNFIWTTDFFYKEYTANINTAAAMTVSFVSSEAPAADSFAVVSMKIWVES